MSPLSLPLSPCALLTFLTLAWHIDSRDCGKIHLECLLQPSLAGKRVLAANSPHGWNQVLAILRKHFPGVSTMAADFEPEIGDTWNQKLDNALAKELVGGEFISVEKSVVDVGKCLGY